MVSVLVVDANSRVRNSVSGFLTEAGHEVIACPGPQPPGFVCTAGRGLPCPLPGDADVVVLAAELGSDWAMCGTPGWRMLDYYLALGKPVVVLSEHQEVPNTPAVDRLVVLPRLPGKDSLITAINSLVYAPEKAIEEDSRVMAPWDPTLDGQTERKFQKGL